MRGARCRRDLGDALLTDADRRSQPLARRFLHSFWQLVVGALLIAGGIALVYLGWWGAAHSRDVTDQIPYVISGGLLGAALIVLGGSFYFSFYVARLHAATRRQAAALERAIERLDALGRLPGVPAQAGGSVVVPEGATWFHRPGCQLAEGKAGSSMSAAEAAGRGLEACKVCEPVPR